MKATTVWKEGMSSVMSNNRGHEIRIDLPEAKGGKDLGATAIEVCLMSYTGCATTIFNMIAQKMRIHIDALTVDATAHNKSEGFGFTDVEIVVKLSSDASDEKIQKCLEQTLKTCPVGVIFHQAGINTSYTVERI